MRGCDSGLPFFELWVNVRWGAMRVSSQVKIKNKGGKRARVMLLMLGGREGEEY